MVLDDTNNVYNNNKATKSKSFDVPLFLFLSLTVIITSAVIWAFFSKNEANFQTLSTADPKEFKTIQGVMTAINEILLTKTFLEAILSGVKENKIPTIHSYYFNFEEIGKARYKIFQMNDFRTELIGQKRKRNEELDDIMSIVKLRQEDNLKILDKLEKIEPNLKELQTQKEEVISNALLNMKKVL